MPVIDVCAWHVRCLLVGTSEVRQCPIAGDANGLNSECFYLL